MWPNSVSDPDYDDDVAEAGWRVELPRVGASLFLIYPQLLLINNHSGLCRRLPAPVARRPPFLAVRAVAFHDPLHASEQPE